MLDILVPARHVRNWDGSVHYAAELAALIDGSLTGVYVCEPLAAMWGIDSPVLLSEGVAYLQEHLKTAREADRAFNDWARGLGVRNSHWRVANSNYLPALSYASHWHDLLVLKSDPDLIGEVGGLLLSVGLPCLLVPERLEHAQLNCIAMAWNGSIESIRAIHAALPLLTHAKRLVLLRGERRLPISAEHWKPAFEIDEYLERHGFQVTNCMLDTSDDRAGEALLSAAAEANADLLVMGGYGRARFSEWVLGGATRHVLKHSSIPVFMRH